MQCSRCKTGVLNEDSQTLDSASFLVMAFAGMFLSREELQKRFCPVCRSFLNRVIALLAVFGLLAVIVPLLIWLLR